MWVTDGKKEKLFNKMLVEPVSNDVELEMKELMNGFKHFTGEVIPGVMITEIIHPSDLRTRSLLCDESKKRELAGMIRWDVFEIA